MIQELKKEGGGMQEQEKGKKKERKRNENDWRVEEEETELKYCARTDKIRGERVNKMDELIDEW